MPPSTPPSPPTHVALRLPFPDISLCYRKASITPQSVVLLFASLLRPTPLACSLHPCGNVQLWLDDSIFDALPAVTAAPAEWEAQPGCGSYLVYASMSYMVKHCHLSLRSVHAVSHALSHAVQESCSRRYVCPHTGQTEVVETVCPQQTLHTRVSCRQLCASKVYLCMHVSLSIISCHVDDACKVTS